MKTIFILLFSILIGVSASARSKLNITVAPFDYKKHDLDGCGETAYLTKGDRRLQKNTILLTDYMTAVMMINGKMERLKVSNSNDKSIAVYTNKSYRVTLRKTNKKNQDDEYYQMDLLLVIKIDNKIVYQKAIYGEGGC